MLLLLMFVRVLTKVPSRYSFGTFTKLVVKCSSQALMYNVCAIVTHNLNGRLAVSLHSGSGSLDLVAAPGGRIANVRAREGNRLLHVDLAIDLLKKLQKHLRNSRITTALGSLLVLVVKIVYLLFLQTQTLPLPVSPYFLSRLHVSFPSRPISLSSSLSAPASSSSHGSRRSFVVRCEAHPSSFRRRGMPDP